MKKYKMTLTKQDFRKFFFYSYYFMQNRFIGFMRLYMGPFLVVAAAYVYNEDLGVSPFMIAFAAAFGFIYAFKPLITLMAQNIKDVDIIFSYHKNILHLKDDGHEGDINLNKNKLEENKKYYYIKLDNGQMIFFPKEDLDKSIKELLQGIVSGEL